MKLAGKDIYPPSSGSLDTTFFLTSAFRDSLDFLLKKGLSSHYHFLSLPSVTGSPEGRGWPSNVAEFVGLNLLLPREVTI